MRAAFAVLLLLALAGCIEEAHAASIGGGAIGSGDIGYGMGNTITVPRIADPCGELPDVFVWQFDAEDIDANNSGNSAYTNGDYVPIWSNDGGSDPDSADIGITSNDGYKPTFQKSVIGTRDAVAFDGIADHRQISTSTASAAFVHETGDFHFIFVFRPDVVSIDFKTLAANTNTSADDGFIFWMTAAGTVRTLIPRGIGGTFAFDYTSTFTFSVGTWAVFEAKADSTPPASGTLSVAKNFGSFETQALLNTFGTGNATNDWAIGASPPTADYPFDGVMALVLVANRQLTVQERADVQSVVSCRYGL